MLKRIAIVTPTAAIDFMRADEISLQGVTKRVSEKYNRKIIIHTPVLS